MKSRICKGLFLMTIFMFLGCGQVELYVPVEKGGNVSQTRPSLKLISKIPKSSKTYDISPEFTFLENQKIWSTAGWNSKVDHFSFSGDYGKTWDEVRLPVEYFGLGGELTFVGSENGWAVAFRNILRTRDGGTSWEKLSLPEGSKIAGLDAVSFYDANNGFVAGSTGQVVERGSGKYAVGFEILCTSDGGETFAVCYKSSEHETVWSLVWTSPNKAFALVDGSTIVRTDDNGKNWTETSVDDPTKVIEVSSDGRLWSKSENGGLRLSSNFGETWELVPIDNLKERKVNWRSVAFGKNGLGIAVGDGGVIAVSTDSGHSWEIHREIITENLIKVKIQDSTIAILGENEFYVLRAE